ncbi:Cys-tRNA(Pro) deacylase [bacterium]|nr:Cys-tRNA(Pro) deacylase [bacterium]
MARTRALDALDSAGVDYMEHAYEVPAGGDLSYGEAVAAVLGIESDRVFKTLVAVVDGDPVVAIVPVSGSLSLKALARAHGGKHSAMAEVALAERVTGYKVGGISPFGRRTDLPVYVDEWVEAHDSVFVSGGLRGLQVEVAPADLITSIGATVATLAA